MPEIDTAAHFIVDLDGTLIRGGRAVAGAAELLRHIEGRYVIVSNNSTDTAISLARTLRNAGLAVDVGRLILAGEQTIRFMAEHHGAARIMLLGSPVIRRYARRLKLKLVNQGADFVVLARDKRFDYRALSNAINELRCGARLIVTNPDLSHPGENDRLVPETGTLMQAIAACAGVEPMRIIGKPNEGLFVEGLRRLNAEAAETLVIGDNPATDALGAAKLGMGFLLVGTMDSSHAPAINGKTAVPLTLAVAQARTQRRS